jgi:hypothetical protein
MRHPRFGPWVLVLAAAVGAASAQSSRPASDPASDERVSVTLKNGESLTGIALRGVKNERLVAGRFEPAKDATGPKTGVRLYYYRELDGYLFLEHKQIEKLEVLDTLTREQSKELADAMAAARRGREAARKAVDAARRESESRPSPEEGDVPEDKPKRTGPEPLTEDEKALLTKFPPSEGWSPETFGELKRRSIVLHVYPNANEQEFLDNFASWQKAWTKWSALQAKESPEKPKDG